MHPTCGVNLFTGASTEANLCREGPFLCRGAANARAVNFHNVSLRVSEGRTMLASVIQSGSRLEVKSRTEFVENVAGFILVRDTPYLKLYLKVTKKSSSAQVFGRGRARKSHCVLIKRVTLLVILLVST